MLDITTIKNYFSQLQQDVCDALRQFENIDIQFIADPWEHQNGGGGCSKVLIGGDIFESAGVNFSHVMGDQLPPAATVQRPELVKRRFEAMGVSVVVHPSNPYVPTSHMNVRFFLAHPNNSSEDPVWWFGGGFDLTPYYGFEEDCVHWHKTAEACCRFFSEELYLRFKQQCDSYFYLKHRKEPRGIGGIFFDDFNELGFERSFDFVRTVGQGYIDAYMPIVRRRKDTAYGERERSFQLYRRGRYVEFNLVWDRGTLFGLQTGGRTESILMSLPPEVHWRYNWQPESGSEEEKLYQRFLVVRDWL